MLVAMPLPLTDLFRDGLSPWEDVRRTGRPRPGSHGLLGLGEPAGGPQGAGPHGTPGRRVRGEGVQVLQRALRLRDAVPVADGRPADRLPDLREGPGARDQPDRRAQGRAAGPAADRAHPDLGHGRRGRQLPRHQLRHLPRRAAVPRRDVLAADPLPEPVRLAGGDASTSWSGRRGCSPRSSGSCCSGAARTRSSTAPRRRSSTRSGRCRPSGTSRSRRTSATATATRSSPTSAKRKILGENLLRLHGMDVAETTARLGRPQAH